MPESFGARLRQQRERRQIALTSVADQTKIKLSLLEGLERDDLSHWPAGVFRRAFVRAYAQTIGLEPEPIVREFRELYPDPDDDDGAIRPGPNGQAASQQPSTRLGCLVASVVGSLSSFRHHAVEIPDPDLAQTVVAEPEPAKIPVCSEPDLSAVARLCTDLGRVVEIGEVGPLLERAAAILDAQGLIVWIWDARAAALKPAGAHGYSPEMIAKLPGVRCDTNNATAASFRSAQTQVVDASDVACGALVVPLVAWTGCVGVLAVELKNGGEQKEPVRALTTIFAAQLAQFAGSQPLAAAVNI